MFVQLFCQLDVSNEDTYTVFIINKRGDKMNYEETALILKAISNPHRLKIVRILSCGQLCACHLLEHFQFSQPTLSHHMKVLEEAGVVLAEKKGKWQHYQLSPEFIENLRELPVHLLEPGKDCECYQMSFHQEDCL